MKLARRTQPVERVVSLSDGRKVGERQIAELPFLQSRTCYPSPPFAAQAAEQFGAVAQLGERCVRNAEVEGSTPFRST